MTSFRKILIEVILVLVLSVIIILSVLIAAQYVLLAR